MRDFSRSFRKHLFQPFSMLCNLCDIDPLISVSIFVVCCAYLILTLSEPKCPFELLLFCVCNFHSLNEPGLWKKMSTLHLHWPFPEHPHYSNITGPSVWLFPVWSANTSKEKNYCIPFKAPSEHVPSVKWDNKQAGGDHRVVVCLHDC